MRDIYTFYPKVRAIQRLEGPARLLNTPFNIPNITPASKGLDCGLTRDFPFGEAPEKLCHPIGGGE
jgi:hypothetical protein